MVHNDVALFGAGGYTGFELCKLLGLHPSVRFVCAASDSNAGKSVDEVTGASSQLSFVKTEEAMETKANIALLAVPPEAALKLAPPLLAKGMRVIDLSNAYRASSEAVYGFASLFASEIRTANLIANPGCYATCVITALAPLVRHNLSDELVAVSAGSGVTGAGRSSDEALSLGELHDNVRAYKVLRHQHVPEIEATLARLGSKPRVILTTHLLPIARGIFATITVKLRGGTTTEQLVEHMRADYADDPTVTVMKTPEDVSLRKVVGTNQTHIGVAASGDVAVVTAAIDNLMKGAASQAIENMNIMLRLPRVTGLLHLTRHA
ncbi:MAG: N-acetyl-gamma-glutamyl-phosphate reductase [Kofleriaceae bacterium]